MGSVPAFSIWRRRGAIASPWGRRRAFNRFNGGGLVCLRLASAQKRGLVPEQKPPAVAYRPLPVATVATRPPADSAASGTPSSASGCSSRNRGRFRFWLRFWLRDVHRISWGNSYPTWNNVCGGEAPCRCSEQRVSTGASRNRPWDDIGIVVGGRGRV